MTASDASAAILRLLATDRHVSLLTTRRSLPASAVDGTEPRSPRMSCSQDFDATQQLHMESFARFDAATFRRLHHPEAVVVLPKGEIRRGVDAVMAALAPHFQMQRSIYVWNEIHRFVDDCRAAYIVYQTNYTDPPFGATVRALRSVTHVHEQGRWLVIADQATIVER